MDLINEIKTSVYEKRKIEHLEADNQKLIANLDYLAIMNDIEIPLESEESEVIDYEQQL